MTVIIRIKENAKQDTYNLCDPGDYMELRNLYGIPFVNSVERMKKGEKIVMGNLLIRCLDRREPKWEDDYNDYA